MGAACCIAARDGTIINRSPGAAIQRHSRHSPSWSFRWDNRGRVAGEETTVDWFHRENDHMENKSHTTVDATFHSEDGSPLDSFRALSWQKSPVEGNRRSLMLSSSDAAVSCDLGEIKESLGSPSVLYQSPVKLSPSVSSMSASPLSSQSHLLPPNANPSRGHHRSPAHPFLRQVSDGRIHEYRSPTFSISEEPSSFILPVWGNESTRGSNVGFTESWSIPAFYEYTTPHKERRWSFDSETSSLSRDKFTRNSGHKSGSSFDLQTCFICSKLLTERSSWRWCTQKIINSNEIAVVSVLTCGHVYHGECLEYMTPEMNKYDPTCPVCSLSDKKSYKLPSIDISLDPHKAARNSKMSSTSGTKSSTGKPFFAFGSRTTQSISVNHQSTTPRKGVFWAKSSRY